MVVKRLEEGEVGGGGGEAGAAREGGDRLRKGYREVGARGTDVGRSDGEVGRGWQRLRRDSEMLRKGCKEGVHSGGQVGRG